MTPDDTLGDILRFIDENQIGSREYSLLMRPDTWMWVKYRIMREAALYPVFTMRYPIRRIGGLEVITNPKAIIEPERIFMIWWDRESLTVPIWRIWATLHVDRESS